MVGLDRLSFREAFDADRCFPRASAEEAGFPPFIEHGHLYFVGGGAKHGEGGVKRVFDGFAACFGLIHWGSSNR